MAADLPVLLLHALAATALAGLVALPLAVALARLPPGGAATLGALLLLPALLGLPGVAGLGAQAAPLLPFIALPLAWGLLRIPAGAPRIVASLAGPALVLWRVWLPLAFPWLLAGLALGFARALAGAGLVRPAALLLAVAAWPVLRALSAASRRDT